MYAFHSVLSLLRVNINFVPFKGIFYTNVPFKGKSLSRKSEHVPVYAKCH